MPAAWVADEKKWKRAKEIVTERRGKKEKDFDDVDWGLVSHIYFLMGGEKKKKYQLAASFEDKLPAIIESYLLYEKKGGSVSWVKDDKKWNRAKSIAAKKTGKTPAIDTPIPPLRMFITTLQHNGAHSHCPKHAPQPQVLQDATPPFRT